MDNYSDAFKPQIIDKLPMSKDTAIAIKKGWLYVLNNLKFYHKGLEYIIIPSMVNFDDEVYKRLLKYLKNSNNIKNLVSKEDSFVRRLSKQIDDFDKDKINQISLDIIFTEVNFTNLSVKIFATLEDVIPSRINSVVKKMKEYSINANIKREANSKETYIRDYFSREELFAIVTKNTAGMKNRVIQEKIYLAKLLLGYEQIELNELLKRFEHNREYTYEHKRRLTDIGVKEWIEYSTGYVNNENKTLEFLDSINSIRSIK
jgi:CRISPR-associated protein Csh1